MSENQNLKIKDAVGIIFSNEMILIGGNGGSAEQANHFVAELIGRFEGNRIAYPAMSMNSNMATVTAIANDYGYDNLFMPFIDAFYKFSNVYIFITTSGKSRNIINAIDNIKCRKIISPIILLTGKEPTGLDVDIEFNIDKDTTYEIQEEHMKILHRIALEMKTQTFGE